jgi:hypothetical protein
MLDISLFTERTFPHPFTKSCHTLQYYYNNPNILTVIIWLVIRLVLLLISRLQCSCFRLLPLIHFVLHMCEYLIYIIRIIQHVHQILPWLITPWHWLSFCTIRSYLIQCFIHTVKYNFIVYVLRLTNQVNKFIIIILSHYCFKYRLTWIHVLVLYFHDCLMDHVVSCFLKC